MKDIKEMTLEELNEEVGELFGYLYLTRENGSYEKFLWNGLDYWDAYRRYYKTSQEILSRKILKK